MCFGQYGFFVLFCIVTICKKMFLINSCFPLCVLNVVWNPCFCCTIFIDVSLCVVIPFFYYLYNICTGLLLLLLFATEFYRCIIVLLAQWIFVRTATQLFARLYLTHIKSNNVNELRQKKTVIEFKRKWEKNNNNLQSTW